MVGRAIFVPQLMHELRTNMSPLSAGKSFLLALAKLKKFLGKLSFCINLKMSFKTFSQIFAYQKSALQLIKLQSVLNCEVKIINFQYRVYSD